MTVQDMKWQNEPGRRVWIFAESDYRFGSGELRMIIESVDWSRPQTDAGESWYDVRGIEVAADGRVIGPRQTMVRASRLNAVR
jgi:hypothetical protein